MKFNKEKCTCIKVVLLLIFICLTFSEAYTQAPSVIWNKIYNSPANKDDYGFSCCSDGSGYLYVTGGKTNSSNNTDPITIKYNQATGDTVWTRVYNNPYGHEGMGFGCCLSNDGFLYVTGYTDLGQSQTDLQLLLLKYNAATGAVVYEKTFGGSTGTAPDENGTTCAYDGTNIYVTGMYFDGVNNKMKLWKFTPAGDTLWTKMIGSTADIDQTYGCALDNAGYIYTTYYIRTGGTDKLALSKFNTSGTLLWTVLSANTKDTAAQQIMSSCTVSGNNIFVTGLFGNIADRYGMTTKYTNTGDTLWTAKNNSSSTYDQNHRCRADISGDVYVCATRYNGTNDDWVMLKYRGTDGVLQWSIVYNATGNNSDYAVDCALDNAGNLFATGFINMNLGNSDMYTVKYQSTVGIQQISGEVPGSFSLKQNYPNPFNSSTRLSFEISKSENVVISVFDITGKEAAMLLNERMQPGSYEINFDASFLNSGIYFYRITAGAFTQTRKMILLK